MKSQFHYHGPQGLNSCHQVYTANSLTSQATLSANILVSKRQSLGHGSISGVLVSMHKALGSIPSISGARYIALLVILAPGKKDQKFVVILDCTVSVRPMRTLSPRMAQATRQDAEAERSPWGLWCFLATHQDGGQHHPASGQLEKLRMTPVLSGGATFIMNDALPCPLSTLKQYAANTISLCVGNRARGGHPCVWLS